MYQKYIKRFFDIVLSLCCIILSSPILLITALLVRIKLGSPVIFKQERPGYHNKVFTLYKFRSMTDAVDENGDLLPDKERLPRFGQLLRSTSLDELPEFFNILFGHMSFVGPRPLLKQYVDFYSARQKRRADVRPGLTGLAQVNGRNAISWEEKFEFDLEYVDSISLLMDIKIILQTVTKVLKRAGISAQESVTMYAFQGTKKDQFSKYKKDGHIKILFSSIGDQVEFIDTFRYAAGKLGVKVTFVGCDHSLEAPALYRCHKHYQVPEPGEEGYVTTLLNICKKEKIGLIIPRTEKDVFILAQRIDEFEAIGTNVLIANEELAVLCSNKRWTGHFFEECGLNYPKIVSNVDDYDQGYPAMFAALDAMDNLKQSIMVQDEKELRFNASKYDNYTIRPFLKGKMYEIDVFCNPDGSPVFITPRAKEEVEGKESARYRVVRDHKIVEEVEKIIQKLKPCGWMTVFMLREEHTQEDFFIRMEPWYHQGSTVSIKAGADAPLATLSMMLGEPMDYKADAADDNVIFTRFEKSVCLNTREEPIVEIHDFKDLYHLDEGIGSVLFDLDDTLYSEKDYIRSSFRVVEKLVPQIDHIFNKLCAALEKGQPPLETVLKEADMYSEELLLRCREAIRDHKPEISLYEGVKELFFELHTQKRSIGILIDGTPKVQRAKIEALGLDKMADEILITDELAGHGNVMEFRKPNDLPFLIMRKRLEVPCRNMAFVGDDVEKDFIAPRGLGMECYWKRNEDGLYE